jgi:hypothetical protein
VAFLYKTVCVMVAGKMGAGKTTFSDMLLAELNKSGWRSGKFALATPIKNIALSMGWDGKKDEKGRKLLQVLGTEGGRAYNENCWVSLLIDKYIPNQPKYPFDVIIIDDWRFPNERTYIENNLLYDVVPIRIVGREASDSNNNHASEISLPNGDYTGYYTKIIGNSGDIYTLQKSAIEFANYLKNTYDKGEK